MTSSPAAIERSEVRFGTKIIGYAIRRSPRRATVAIAVDPAGDVIVTAPQPASVERLDNIVHSKASWILQRLRRQSDRPPAPSAKEFVSGETFLYLGRQHRLRVDLDDSPRPLRLERGWLRVPVPRDLDEAQRAAFVRAALIDWYGARARERLPEHVATWAKKLHIAPPALLVADPRKRWGSASPSGTIRLNWRIIQASRALIDYVVAHELAHLEHPNHTAEFWAALGRVMPDYDGRKVRLRTLGPELGW
jgi:predicted metal-dependent hydrolase